jgi:hypothetical protein
MASGGARAQARFSWEKPFRVAPYIGILHPASSDRCGFSIYMLSIWIHNRFIGDKEEKGGFPQGGGTSSVWTLLDMRMMESYMGWHGPHAGPLPG